jgi:hypothetical protein
VGGGVVSNGNPVNAGAIESNDPGEGVATIVTKNLTR